MIVNFYTIITLINLLAFAALTAIAVFKNFRNALNLAFAWAMLALLGMEGGRFMLLIAPDAARALFWMRISLIGTCLMPANFLLFTLILGQADRKDALKKGMRYLIPVYLITLAFMVFIPSNQFIKQIAEKYPNYYFLYGRVGYAHLFFSLLVILGILSTLEKKYRQIDKGKYFILILIGAFSFQILTHSMAIAFSYTRIDLLTAGSFVFLIANVFLAYLMLSPSLQITKIRISRKVVSKSYTLLLAGFYLLIIGMSGKIIQFIGQSLNFFLSLLIAFTVLLVLMAALVSRSLKQRVLSFIEHNFYKNEYDYREEWENFSKQIFSTFDLEELLHETVEVVSKTIKVGKSCLMIKNENKNKFFVSVSQNLSQPNITFDSNSEFVDWLWRHGKPLNLKPSKRGGNSPKYDQESIEPLRQLDIKVCVPIIAQHEFIAILLLGPKTLGSDKYTSEDMELLETMANQLSIAITNAKLSEELIVSQEMASFQRLSAFILHDLKNAVSMLSMLVQNAEYNIDNPEFQQDMLRTMSEAIGKMQNLMTKLSSIPDELELNLQLTDLSELFQDVIDKSGIKNWNKVRFSCDFQPVPKIAVDLEYIEKVILNLITNAIEAIPEEGDITLRLYSQGEFVLLEVSDTGSGMSQKFIDKHLFKPFQTTKKKGVGIGLYQCQTIVNVHGGRIEVDSTEGVGTTFIVKLPIQD